ncbi:MAG: dienelactone hydrolase family protein [Pseudomonadota bacterium]
MAITTSKISLTGADGVEISAYEASPEGAAKGGVVVIQEIFGVNSHIQAVTNGYAMAGYDAVAPKLFDRIEPDIELGYDEAAMGQGIDLAFARLDRARALADLQEVIAECAARGPVGVVGFCFGGLLTWLCARDLSGVSAASAYYGGGVPGEGGSAAQCPAILHFGDEDAHIPVADVEAFRAQRPETSVYRYPADHGFNCDQRGTFNAEAAKLAHARTLEFFRKNLT